jgi:signal transduction histidine kinase
VEKCAEAQYHGGMKLRLRRYGLGTRLMIPLIAVAVVSIAALQYGWFSRAAEVEIDGAERSLRATAYQALEREFLMYAPLIGDLRELLIRDRASPSDLKLFLEREYLLYGPKGTSPGLIASVELFAGASAALGQALDPSSGAWKAGSRGLPPQLQRPVEDGSGMIYLDSGSKQPSAGGFDQGLVGYIYVTRGGTVPMTVAIGIDADSFFETYIKPAIDEMLPGASIQWIDSRNGDGDGRDKTYWSNRSFNPVFALLGIESKGSRTFSVPVPTGFGSFFRTAPDHGPDSLTIVPSGQRPAAPEGPVPRGEPGMRVAIVTMPKASAIGTMERRLSLNWLFGTGLLIGLGTALVMTVVQKGTLSLTRQREREFVASVTHELRTPVTAIRSAADNIRRGLVSGERLASYGEMIHAEALRLGDMVEEVILSSRVEGRSPSPPALAEVYADKFLEGLRPPLEAIAKAEGVRLSWDFGALPKTFMCDAESLRLIVSNLATNAIYHAYSGEEKGDVRVLGRSSLPSSLRFVVEDDGRGIAKADAQLVFEAFYRDETSRRRAEKGTGLGLFIALRKARELGGDLTLESPYRRVDGSRRPGCRFALELPLREAADAR